MRRAGPAVAALLLLAASRTTSGAEPARLRFAVSYPEALAKGPLDGRLLLLLSTDDSAEPRFQISDTDVAKSQQVFGIDVEGWKPGEARVFDASVLGYPAESLGDVPAGTLPRAGAAPQLRDVPPRGRPRGEAADGPRRRASSGTARPATSSARRASWPSIPRATRRSRLELDQAIPRDPAAGRHEVRQARAASRASGSRSSGDARCTWAPHVLLPAGFDEHPQARYPARHLPRPLPAHDRTASASSRPTRTSSASTPSASTSTATTGSSRSSATSSTRTGPRPTSRASWWSRSSTRTRTTTTPTR